MTEEQDQSEKMDLTSGDVAAGKREQMKQLFPEVFTDDKIDFDQFRRVVGDWVEPGKERYGLNWPGKANCMKTIQAPSIATLKPARDESMNFDNTENLFIEGDNLEVLKLLQKAYFGKIKMIYIDPPYNTGNEFIYPDKYAETLDTYLEYTGQVDAEGRKFSTNTELGGRFHANWLNMMYPRLYLARNLLREDGVIFISINDNEFQNLRSICDQIFGASNFVATLVWEKGRKNDAKRFSVGHEYLVGYAKDLQLIEEIIAPWREPKQGVYEIIEEYKRLKGIHGADHSAISSGLVDFYKSLEEGHPSKKYSRSRFVDERGIWRDNNISWPGGGGPRYELIHPVTKRPCKIPDDGWRFIESTMLEKIEDGYVEFREDHTKSPFLKSYLYIDQEFGKSASDKSGDKQQVMGSVFYRHSQPSNDEIKGLFGSKVFENPKDHEILARLIKYCSDKDSIILDFFAGSASTAQSVLELNASDSGHRKFILVQLPEPCDEATVAAKSGYKTIADVGKDRVRRAAKKISDANTDRLDFVGKDGLDLGFRVFALARSNFKIWDGSAEEVADLTAQLEFHVDHVNPESGPEDILYELLLKAGFELTTKVEKRAMAGKDVFVVDEGALLICLEEEITPTLIDALANADPRQVICLDEGFKGNDQLKTNAVQTFKSRAKEGEDAIVFRTV